MMANAKKLMEKVEKFDIDFIAIANKIGGWCQRRSVAWLIQLKSLKLG
jgi:hypothetical protein